jgi:hypothetical protein
MLPQFQKIFVIDFEFTAEPGERQKPICLVSYEINSGELKKIWLEGKNPLTLKPLYPMSETDLYIAYYSSAEWNCYLILGWPLPNNVIDLYPEFRVLTNGRPGISKGLLGACHLFGVNAISESEKEASRIRIMQGPPYTDKEKEEILNYCASDVLETVELLKKMLPYIDIPRALIRGQYMVTVAVMEYNGVPIDTNTLQRLKANWIQIQQKLILDIDKDYRVYEGTTFKVSEFEKYLISNEIPWPRTEKGNLELKYETFKDMAISYPQLQGLRDLRYILGQLRLLELSVG